jgi:hypothetical protein
MLNGSLVVEAGPPVIGLLAEINGRSVVPPELPVSSRMIACNTGANLHEQGKNDLQTLGHATRWARPPHLCVGLAKSRRVTVLRSARRGVGFTIRIRSADGRVYALE